MGYFRKAVSENDYEAIDTLYKWLRNTRNHRGQKLWLHELTPMESEFRQTAHYKSIEKIVQSQLDGMKPVSEELLESWKPLADKPGNCFAVNLAFHTILNKD